jgi:hypothetical protein
MINPIISTRTRICTRYAVGAQGRWSRAYQRPQRAQDPLLLAGRARLLNERQDVLRTTRHAPSIVNLGRPDQPTPSTRSAQPCYVVWKRDPL